MEFFSVRSHQEQTDINKALSWIHRCIPGFSRNFKDTET